MFIADTREDDTYNQKYLNHNDKEYIKGYDYCTENVVDNFFDNLEDLDSDYLLNILNQKVPEDMRERYTMLFSTPDEREEDRVIVTYADYLRYMLLHRIEIERDEMIVSMIDNMDEDEYDAIKAEIDGE